MRNPERFFIKPEEVDGFTVLYQIMDHARGRYPDAVAYRQIEKKNVESDITFSAFAGHVDALRAFLKSSPFYGKHLALLGESSIEWITAYMAVVSGTGVAVPIDKELPPETIALQLDFADADTVFCSAKSLKKIGAALPLCKEPKTVILMRTDEIPALENTENILTLSSLIADGSRLLEQNGSKALPETIDPDAPAVIIYTSGTTGANKGVVLTNRNIMGTLRGCARLLHYPGTSISVLPINHSYELHAHLMSCMYCGTAVFINDDLKHLLKNLEHAAPEMSCMVPLMLDLIVRKLKKQITDSGKEKLFSRTVKISNALLKVGIDKRRTLFKEILTPLGGNLKMIICGGAALKQETVDFLKGIGIQVYNGYGITECSPVAAVNPDKKPRKNSVGHLLPTMQVRIDNPDETGNGEIQLFGDNVMKGYYKAPEDTDRVFTKDGWFRTGDIGHVDKHDFLYICGRLKNLIILPNGKNISPEEIEEHLIKAIPAIKECVVMATKDNAGLYAVCFPDTDFCRERGLDTPEDKNAYFSEELKKYNSAVPGYKQLMNIEITEKEFEKSTTHKIQRFKIAANH